MLSRNTLRLPSRVPITCHIIPCRPFVRNNTTNALQNPAIQPSRWRRSPWTRRLIYAGIFWAVGASLGLGISTESAPQPIPGSVEDQLKFLETEQFLDSLTLVQDLRRNPDCTETVAYESFGPEQKLHRLTSGPMAGTPHSVPRHCDQILSNRLFSVQRVFWNEKEKNLTSVVFLGNGLEGFPLLVHGGALATVIDENLGRVAIRHFPARTGVTANLNINYRHPTFSNMFYSLHTTLDLERSTDRKAYATCQVRDLSGKVCVEASGLFVVPRNFALAEVGHF
ncbi:hypothetical protein N7495_007485 [Penicillium taxi]|uniref:uncharacterized protein n=1 Tax=Penicillium taxi TaxID=168475 RepID=UPI002544F9F3|nr:uncharacterized protein N7495_007485 [Penicillium taxi]KAJ5887444.1 hypothetical protein N7495_007485 [Penicillium taxi]